MINFLRKLKKLFRDYFSKLYSKNLKNGKTNHFGYFEIMSPRDETQSPNGSERTTTTECLYRILGVTRRADEAEIKKAWVIFVCLIIFLNN